MIKAEKKYAGHNDRTIEYMGIILKSLVNEYGEDFEPSYWLTLDMIADNYDIMIAAKEDVDKNGLEKMDTQGRPAKNQSVLIFNAAQKQIIALLLQFGKTPYSKGRIKKEQSAEDGIEELLEV